MHAIWVHVDLVLCLSKRTMSLPKNGNFSITCHSATITNLSWPQVQMMANPEAPYTPPMGQKRKKDKKKESKTS